MGRGLVVQYVWLEKCGRMVIRWPLGINCCCSVMDTGGGERILIPPLLLFPLPQCV